MSTTAINPIATNASGTASTLNADGTTNATGTAVDSNEFLSLLITQLKNQDPTAPTDQTQMLAQLAQFSSLQQMQSLNATMTSSAQFGSLSQSAALIGKTISAGAGDSAVSGIVDSVSMTGGKTFLHVGQQEVDASTITGIQ